MAYNFFLTIQGIVSAISLQKIQTAVKMDGMEENCLFIFFDYSDFDIPTGGLFLYLANEQNGESYEIRGELRLVTQNQGIILNSIPKGHKTICKICFDMESLRFVTSKIPIVDSWEVLNVQYILAGSTLS